MRRWGPTGAFVRVCAVAEQVRVPAAEIKDLLRRLVEGDATWESCVERFPIQEVAADKD